MGGAYFIPPLSFSFALKILVRPIVIVFIIKIHLIVVLLLVISKVMNNVISTFNKCLCIAMSLFIIVVVVLSFSFLIAKTVKKSAKKKPKRPGYVHVYAHCTRSILNVVIIACLSS